MQWPAIEQNLARTEHTAWKAIEACRIWSQRPGESQLFSQYKAVRFDEVKHNAEAGPELLPPQAFSLHKRALFQSPSSPPSAVQCVSHRICPVFSPSSMQHTSLWSKPLLASCS
eukprot:1152079-Pelagomonas_calceolata.AAC.7